jgi:hypothetical protein
VRFLQHMGFLRTLRLLRCALKVLACQLFVVHSDLEIQPGSVVVTSSRRLVFNGDVGERCEDTPWPPNDQCQEGFEFHRLVIEFCVSVEPDTTPIIFGEKVHPGVCWIESILIDYPDNGF